MTADLNQIYEAIGSLRSEVKNLGQKIDRADANASDGARRADEHRTAIHKRVDDLASDVGEIRTTVGAVKDMASESKRITDKVREWEQRGVGALFVTGIASAAISSTVIGFIVYWWDAIMRALRSA